MLMRMENCQGVRELQLIQFIGCESWKLLSSLSCCGDIIHFQSES